jgi:hypothetical protein
MRWGHEEVVSDLSVGVGGGSVGGEGGWKDEAA